MHPRVLAGTVMYNKPGKRAWGCREDCYKDKTKPTETLYNNATMMEYKQ